jgi:hypothetical protein
MSEYPKHMSPPTFTRYGDFEIIVRTSNDVQSYVLGEFTAAYEIVKAGERISTAHISRVHRSALTAAQNALLVAKVVIFEGHNGPDPGGC